mmetsp:Transcript_13131/g.30594  ORF Transcript_13131/g.30594 Transcript_13131/m.30594 type:complete len:203 (+) Transcript_13131:485-1093(+)
MIGFALAIDGFDRQSRCGSDPPCGECPRSIALGPDRNLERTSPGPGFSWVWDPRNGPGRWAISVLDKFPVWLVSGPAVPRHLLLRALLPSPLLLGSFLHPPASFRAPQSFLVDSEAASLVPRFSFRVVVVVLCVVASCPHWTLISFVQWESCPRILLCRSRPRWSLGGLRWKRVRPRSFPLVLLGRVLASYLCTRVRVQGHR